MIRIFPIMAFLLVLAATNTMLCKAIETLPASKASLETLTGPGRWYAVEFEGSSSSSSSRSTNDAPMCGDGTPFSFLFRKASSSQHDTKWLVEFQSSGGPACWLTDDDEEGGDHGSGSCCEASPSQLRTPWYETSMDDFPDDASQLPFLMVDDVPACVGWPQGLVQHDMAKIFLAKEDGDIPIPLRPTSQDCLGDWWQGDIQDYNYVLVPDCTADAHLGMMTKTVEYETSCNAPTTTNSTNTTTPSLLSIHHRGGINRRAVMDWIQNEDHHVVDALITVAGGRSLEDGTCHGSHNRAPYFSSMAPLLASAQVATEFHSISTVAPQTLTIQEGTGLFLDNMPTRSQLESSWNVQDDDLWDAAMIGGSNQSSNADANKSNNDQLDITHVAQQLVTDLVSSSTSSSSNPNDLLHHHTVVWTASAQGSSTQLEWLDPLQAQSLPVYVYLTQDLSSSSLHNGGNTEQPSCPRFAFPDHSEGFASFLATEVAWNPQTTTVEKTTVATATVEAESTKYRLTFLSVALIVVGLVLLLYATYFGLRHYRLQHGQSSPPSPVDLWLGALTRYPGIFLAVSLGIPILLSALAFHRQNYQVKVNLDFDSYLEINTDLENTRRAYEWKQDQQWASRDMERDHCDYLNKESNDDDSLFANRFRHRKLQLQEKGVDMTLGHVDLVHAVDWDRLLVHHDDNIDAHLGFDNINGHLVRRRLDLANMLYASGGEVISIMYQNANGGNVFEPDVLKDIHAFEQAIYTFPGFSNYCFGFAGVRCLPIDSLVTHFFDSSGRLTENIDGVTRSFLGNQPALWKLDQYFGPNNLGSNVTRSFVFLRNVGGDQSLAHPFLESFYRDYLWKTDSPNRPRKKPYKNMVHTWDNTYLSQVEAEDALNHDTMWSIGSLAFIALMIALKVQNLFVTSLSMVGLILSFFTAYYWVWAHFAIENATLLWVAGLFVMLGIGADDIFLMVDSFEHTKSSQLAVVGENDEEDDASKADQDDARLDVLRHRMTEAYRTAGSMMLVSSITTAICFFSNAFGVLVVIQEFGIFMGMVVLVNYIHVMTILPSAILVNEIYVSSYRKRFSTWLRTKTGRGSTSAASLTEEQEDVASNRIDDNESSRDDLEIANMSFASTSNFHRRQSHAKFIKEGVSSHIEASTTGIDRLLVEHYAPFLSRRRVLVLAGCVVLTVVLGVVGVLKFTMGDGSIVLFSEQYNLGRLSVVNDLYFNSAISKTIEDNQADPIPAPVAAPPGSNASSGGSSASLPGSVTQGGGSSNTDGGFSGSSTGYKPGAPQDPVGNSAGSNSNEDTVPPLDDDQYVVEIPGSDISGPSEGSNGAQGSSNSGSGSDSNSSPGSSSSSSSGLSSGSDSNSSSGPSSSSGSNSSSSSGSNSGSSSSSSSSSGSSSGSSASSSSGSSSNSSSGSSSGSSSSSGSGSSSGSLPSTSEGVLAGNVGAVPLGPNSGKDLRRVEAVNIRLIWGVEPPPTSGSALWKMPERASRSTGIHEGLERTTTLDLSRPELQSWLLATITKAREDKTMHVLSKKTWIEHLRDYATSNSIVFPIPREAFEGHLQRLKQQNEVFARQIDDHIGTLGPGLAGDYTFVSLEFQADAIASLDGAPSSALSEIVYKKWNGFASMINAEAKNSPESALPTVVAQSRIFLDAYRVDATIESTVISWLVANGLCMLVILLFTHNLALSFMVMVTITLILLCLSGLLFGLAKIPFGPVEALGVSIFIGLSANYSLHVVHAYQHSPIGAQTRPAKVQHAIFAVGSPIVASALSTMGAAAFLFGCRTWVFVELGILLLCITSMALLFSMTFLLAWLSLVGPGAYLDHRGKMVHRWDLRELFWSSWTKNCCRQGRKGRTMDQRDNIEGFELAIATAKCQPSTISTDNDGSFQNGSIVTSASSYALPTQSSGHNIMNKDSAKWKSAESDDDDDYSIEVTSDDETD